MDDFICSHCNFQIVNTPQMGVKNRNHCPKCLWSKHVDEQNAGDRASNCKGLMQPIGLTFKKTSLNKYGKKQSGELMLVHRCQKCGKISINRIAADDDEKKIFNVFKNLLTNHELRSELTDINLLSQQDEVELKKQLFGTKP